MRDTTYVILLNWNGWQDTIACLSSLFASTGANFRVVVCDNDSSDGSLDNIQAWAAGEIAADVPENPRLARLMRHTARGVGCTRLTRAQAETGSVACNHPLILIENGDNLGFAAGNNIGIRYALRQDNMDTVWLLNNDTLVEPDCLAHMRARLREAGDDAVCGSVIHFFDQPEVIQAVGGNSFNAQTGIAGCSLGRFTHELDLGPVERWEPQVDYLSGCSLMWPRAALEEIGLLNDAYFLYYEEIDWFTRNNQQFPCLIARDARLYHREGSAIGSPTAGRRASRLSDFHMFRSRVLFMKTYYPQRTFSLVAGLAKEILKRVFGGQIGSVTTIMGATRSAWGV